jgi:transcriptional regulator with XRE-family HTH domain
MTNARDAERQPPSTRGVEDAAGAAAAVAAALAGAPERLRTVRTQRRMTLTGVAAATGISKSTLSRLETGQRRPTLELLLTLSQTYRVPLDELVGAPDVGDPRIRLKPGQVKGRTVIPLSRQPDSMQAWKIVIPTSKVDPEPRWFGSTGEAPAEILSIFGRPGERMNDRTPEV